MGLVSGRRGLILHCGPLTLISIDDQRMCSSIGINTLPIKTSLVLKVEVIELALHLRFTLSRAVKLR